MPDDTFEAAAECLDRCLEAHGQMAERIYRQLLIALHTRGIVLIDTISEEARRLSGRAPRPHIENPNVPADQRLDDADREILQRLTRTYVCKHLSCSEIEDQVNLALKREEAQSLRDVANLPTVSFRVLGELVRRFCALPLGETQLDASELYGIRVALARHFMTDDLRFLGIAKKHLRVRAYEEIVSRMIGSDARIGKVGGKASGMLLAYYIVASAGLEASPDMPIAIPESYYLRSDVTDQFLELNGLTVYHSQKYKDIDDIRNEYPLIKGVFRNSPFPVEIVQQLRALLERLGEDPLIVRSSSLLEDRLTSTFSGKYASVFLPNQGPLELRLRALLGAIGEIYASTLAPDPILYRRNHDLIEYHEDMAVLIQKVVGQRFGKYFLPAFAGVAFSRNEYRWSPRIRREDGFMRLVMGLGTRAVDRVGGDYARMVALGAPTLRSESTPEEIIAHCQKTIDVINLETNRFETVPLAGLLASGGNFPMLDRIVSFRREHELVSPTGKFVEESPDRLYITFDKMLKETPLARRTLELLQLLEKEFECPVDVEFACDGERFYMLQCRPLPQTPEAGHVSIPKDIREDRIIFTANTFVRNAQVEDIEYVVYVNSRAYHAVTSHECLVGIGRVVGRLNDALADKRFILVGPGRWGSNDIRLGVRVTYADISNAGMLIEVARVRDGYVPEVSFGTHFFQDLVEADIAYLPLYPDDAANRFDDAFFNGTPNSLAALSPGDAEFQHVVRVIHVPSVANGAKLQILMDGDKDRAVAYLETKRAEVEG